MELAYKIACMVGVSILFVIVTGIFCMAMYLHFEFAKIRMKLMSDLNKEQERLLQRITERNQKNV